MTGRARRGKGSEPNKLENVWKEDLMHLHKFVQIGEATKTFMGCVLGGTARTFASSATLHLQVKPAGHAGTIFTH